MPLDAFVPVIVEAVRFFFGRWGKKLDREQEERGKLLEPSLAIPPDSFEEFLQRPHEFLVKSINDETAALLEDQLKSLMRRMRTRQRLIDRRAELTILAGGDARARMELQNEDEDTAQARDWAQLTALLNRVIIPHPDSDSVERS